MARVTFKNCVQLAFGLIFFYYRREKMTKGRTSKLIKKSREWILEKKERRRRQGKSTREDTKYTGRSRSGRF